MTNPAAVLRAPSRRRNLRRPWIGWLFIAPFGVIFLVFLVAPLVYAFYLSLFSKGLATGTIFSGAGNYVKAFTDPEFLSGIWFVIRFAVILIPIQMAVSLAAALVLDALTTRLSRFARLAIFVPYAIPAVVGTLMWGFLYSPTFGPLTDLFKVVNQSAPEILSSGNIFGGLLNIVVWQWAGYYMIIIYAALRGIDPSIYEAARIDGAGPRQIAFRIKVPMISSAMALILVFALIGTLQFFTEPQVLRPISNGSITSSFTPNIYAFDLAFRFSQFNYASTISFSLGIVVFIAVYIFLFASRKRRGGLS
ncbi:sugar ABC transporter permease [Agreia pratensis]|uniref:Multiple sugar transport system permease protein n=1 Tax=Agreia pratensis TaxID=150121 RepID=A0A1X7IJE4_9MICO|nr:sugar ABC transporter permease [Agreia pratensis]MBF4633156.1 sugar ABC transporter permease [Agreia pratensis]SMG14431.1 multiple sugar transport system permease protein [Agreia pratensis]